MQPIRILQVFTHMNRGGAETMIMNYYRALDKTKVQFDFLLHRQERGVFDDEIEKLGGKIYRLPPIAPKNYFTYKKALKKFFKKHTEYQIIHSHINALSYWALKAAKENGVPVRIAHAHTTIEPLVKKIFLKNIDFATTIKDVIQSIVRNAVPNVATHYFACANKAGEWLFGRKNKNKITVINNSLDTSLFSFDNIKSIRYKKELNFNSTKIIGHVGNFTEAKNYFFLIKIFKELTLLNESVLLVLIGDGDLKPKIVIEVDKLNLNNKVVFLGIRSDIPELLQALDLFLFPSLYEGLPLTLIEAQAAGLKIIASDAITKEVAITDLITFCSLKDSGKVWAEKIMENLDYNRRDTTTEIVDGNYDIAINAKNLQNFYLNF